MSWSFFRVYTSSLLFFKLWTPFHLRSYCNVYYEYILVHKLRLNILEIPVLVQSLKSSNIVPSLWEAFKCAVAANSYVGVG